MHAWRTVAPIAVSTETLNNNRLLFVQLWHSQACRAGSTSGILKINSCQEVNVLYMRTTHSLCLFVAVLELSQGNLCWSETSTYNEQVTLHPPSSNLRWACPAYLANSLQCMQKLAQKGNRYLKDGIAVYINASTFAPLLVQWVFSARCMLTICPQIDIVKWLWTLWVCNNYIEWEAW